MNWQANGFNHVKHLLGKTNSLQDLVRGGKVLEGEEDILAGLVVWQVVARPVVEYGSEVWACSSEHSEQKLEVGQKSPR